jgi:Ser/Thr protein kinase RdoA (MazF antagonist)
MEFGFSGGVFTEIPSFSHEVVRMTTTSGVAYIKRYSTSMEVRVRGTAKLAEAIAQKGIPAPTFCRTKAGEIGVHLRQSLFTLSGSVSERPLLNSQLSTASESPASFLASLQAVLAGVDLEIDSLGPCPAMWNSFDIAGRIEESSAHLRRSDSTRRHEFLAALEELSELLTNTPSLHKLQTPFGVVHGDFWPGNIVLTRKFADSFGILDLDDAMYGPLLLDVAQFVDLAYAIFVDGVKTGIRIREATSFARRYAREAGMDNDALAGLPDVLIAARICSAMWIIEQHLLRGPSALDGLLQNDMRTLRFVIRQRDELREVLLQKSEAFAVV